jgi:hypothetical protein
MKMLRVTAGVGCDAEFFSVAQTLLPVGALVLVLLVPVVPASTRSRMPSSMHRPPLYPQQPKPPSMSIARASLHPNFISNRLWCSGIMTIPSLASQRSLATWQDIQLMRHLSDKLSCGGQRHAISHCSQSFGLCKRVFKGKIQPQTGAW